MRFSKKELVIGITYDNLEYCNIKLIIVNEKHFKI